MVSLNCGDTRLSITCSENDKIPTHLCRVMAQFIEESENITKAEALLMLEQTLDLYGIE